MFNIGHFNDGKLSKKIDHRALSIQIINYVIKEEEGGSKLWYKLSNNSQYYVEYTIEIIYNHQINYKIQKRYNEFHKLHQSLLETTKNDDFHSCV